MVATRFKHARQAPERVEAGLKPDLTDVAGAMTDKTASVRPAIWKAERWMAATSGRW